MSLNRTQSRGVLLVIAAASAGVVLGIAGLVIGSQILAVFGGLAAMWLPVAAALFLVVAERRRHEIIASSLQAQATFLERLVESMGRIADVADSESVSELAASEAQDLFAARSVRVFDNERDHEVSIDGNTMTIPIRSSDSIVDTIELRRDEPFTRTDAVRATVLADFASSAAQKTLLLTEAHNREAERARLTEQVITAEQDERRRLSLFLHDGPLQQMSGIALMHDAALAALEDKRYEDATKVVSAALERERTTIRTLRDLSFSIEPLVLRDHGFIAAVHALGDQVRSSNRIEVTLSVDGGEEMGEKCQAAVYQIMRDAITQAVRRKPTHIEVTLNQISDGTFETTVTDDGVEEKRRASLESIEERVQVLNGRFSFSTGPDGTVVRVSVPAYVAAAAA